MGGGFNDLILQMQVLKFRPAGRRPTYLASTIPFLRKSLEEAVRREVKEEAGVLVGGDDRALNTGSFPFHMSELRVRTFPSMIEHADSNVVSMVPPLIGALRSGAASTTLVNPGRSATVPAAS